MAVVGAGLVGLSLAYELACLGASVTVVDAAHPGRATDAGAGILSPATSTEADAGLWPFLRQAGAHYPAFLARLAGTGPISSRPPTAPAGSFPLACAPTRTAGSHRSPSWPCVARPARCPRSRPPPRGSSSRPWARCIACCMHRARPASTGGAWPARCGTPRRRAAWPSSRAPSRASPRRCPGSARSGRSGCGVGAASTAGRWRWRVGPGRPPPANGSAATSRSGRPRDRSCTSASRQRRAAGPSCSPC